MKRLALTLAFVAASGCGPGAASSSRSAREAQARTSISAALDLVWTIEGHAASCSITRPTMFSDARRSLLARFRPELALGYAIDPDDPADAPRSLAFARCVVGDEHASREHTMVRFSRPLTTADRERITEALPFAARWQDEPCDTLTCGWRALRLVTSDTIEIEGPPRPGIDTSQPDVRRLVASELAARPESFEITAARAGSTRIVVLYSLERMTRGIARLRRHLSTQPGGSATLDLAETAALSVAIEELAPRVGPDHLGFRIRGDTSEEYLPLPWSTVEVSVADLDLERRTRVRRAARDRILPLTEIDLDEPRAIHRQASARALAIRVSRDTQRRVAWSRERAELLGRLFDLTEDVTAALDAVTQLRDLGDLDAAHALAARALELLPEDAAIRSAYVDTATDATIDATLAQLRPSLSADERRALGAGVISGRDQGLSFTTVEASFDVHRAQAPTVTTRAPGIEVPREALAELAYLLLRAADPERAITSFAARVDGALLADAVLGVVQLGARWPSGASASFATVPAPAPLSRLRWISQALASQLPRAGEVRLTVFATLADGAPRAITLRLAIEGGSARVVSSSVALAPNVWTAFTRDAVRPSTAIAGTAFPPPVLRLTLAAPLRARVASRVIGDRVSGLRGGLCTLESAVLVCTGHERGPEALLDVLAIVADETIAP